MSGFAYLSDLLQRRSAMVLDARQDYLVEARLMPLASEVGDHSLQAFLTRLQNEPEGSLHSRVVEAMTVNETSWFRDRQPFRELAEVILPAVTARSRYPREVRIWSAGCASGQEPYTLAMVLEQEMPKYPGWTASILATDLSSAMVERTAEGRYNQIEVNRGLPASLLIKYFHRAGTMWEVAEELRKYVTVTRHNLATEAPPLARVDVLFLRNVLIYFGIDAKRQVMSRTRSALDPNGFLVLGSAETTINVDPGFVRGGQGQASWYQLRGEGSP